MIEVGIYGASGYMGGEAIRVLLEHPRVEIAWATSRTEQPIEFCHRNLTGTGIRLVPPDQATPCDLVLMALPTGKAMEMAQGLLEQQTKVIDLGADFRLKNREDWERIYGKTHANWGLVEQAVYGIPEFHREAIRQTPIIANPGCFSSAAIFGLAPLIKHDVIDPEKIIVDGLSGTAGAGAELDTPIHHPEIGNNLVPYNVVDHRHTYEIEQELGNLTTDKVSVHFTSVYVPITRGILAICHGFPLQKTNRDDLVALYRDFYHNEPFVKVVDAPKDSKATWQYRPYPWVAAVSGTNYCHIGLDFDARRNRIVVFSVLDSIGKGGAHAAVQNMNLMFGWDEDLGLKRYGLHPY